MWYKLDENNVVVQTIFSPNTLDASLLDGFVQADDSIGDVAGKLYDPATNTFSDAPEANDEFSVREKRNALLAETDWWAGSDHTMTQAQRDYRQALRDVPNQQDFPTNVSWPTKP